MKKNMSTLDRLVRTVLAIIALYLFSNETLSGPIGGIAVIISFVFLATSVFSFCPLYSLFGFSTCKVES